VNTRGDVCAAVKLPTFIVNFSMLCYVMFARKLPFHKFQILGALKAVVFKVICSPALLVDMDIFLYFVTPTRKPVLDFHYKFPTVYTSWHCYFLPVRLHDIFCDVQLIHVQFQTLLMYRYSSNIIDFATKVSLAAFPLAQGKFTAAEVTRLAFPLAQGLFAFVISTPFVVLKAVFLPAAVVDIALLQLEVFRIKNRLLAL